MKYKVGDKVRIKEHCDDCCREPGCLEFDTRGEMRSLIGKQARIVSVDYCYRLDVDNGKWGWSDCMLEKAGGKHKEEPYRFIAVYDETSRDPHRLFRSKQELNVWLKEAVNDTNIVFKSIKVFELGKEYKVRTTFRLYKK